MKAAIAVTPAVASVGSARKVVSGLAMRNWPHEGLSHDGRTFTVDRHVEAASFVRATRLTQRRLVKHAYRSALLALGLFALVANAQQPPGSPRYRLTQGAGYPVCRALLNNFNSFPLDEPPMACEQKIHPTHREFIRPAWEELDVAANLQMVYEAEGLLKRFTPSGTTQSPREEWEAAFRERIATGAAEPRLRKTSVIIGTEPVTLISYEPIANECAVEIAEQGVAGDPGGYLFSVRPGSSELEIVSGAFAQSRKDVLLYEGIYPYVTSTTADFDVLEVRKDDGDLVRQLNPTYSIGLHALGGPIVGSDRYAAQVRCYVKVDRPARP